MSIFPRPFTLAVAYLLVGMFAAGFCLASQDIVTLMLPEEVVKESIQNVLPLPIDPQSEHLQGSLVLDSIDRLVMTDNGAHVQGTVLGKDIILTTRIGNQDFRVQVGTVRLPLSCDFTFRFDRGRKVLYVKPLLQTPAPTNNPQADAILPFLVLLNNREYPVSLASIQTFNGRVAGRDIAVDMEPYDISISARQLVVKMKPRVRKTN